MLVDPAYRRRDLQEMVGFRTVVAAPMMLDDEVVGALSLLRSEVEPFDPGAVALLEAFAAQAAIVVRHVDLLAALDARGAELARRVDQLEALSAVGGIVSSSLVLDEVLATIIKNAVRFSGCDGGSMMEYLEEEQLFSVRSAYASSPELLAALRVGARSSSAARWSDAPRSSGTRWRSPTWTRSTSTPTWRCCTPTAGAPCSPSPCCAASGSSAPSWCAVAPPGRSRRRRSTSWRRSPASRRSP